MTFATSNISLPTAAQKMRVEQTDAEIIQRAAEWYAHLHSDDVQEQDRLAFEEWCKRHPDHVEIYARMTKLCARFDGLDTKPATIALQKALQSRQLKNKSLVAKTAAIFVLIVGAWLGLNTAPANYLLADYSTAVGEQRVIELADHSRITLNTDTAVDVDFSGAQRRITLRQGEILIDVAKDASRPFIVETKHGSARALGTQYVVRRNADSTDVTVIESTVQACAAKVSSCVNVNAGEQTTVTEDVVQKPIRVDAQSVSSWTKHMLVVDDQPLAQVLRELERYRHGRIYFDADKIADLRVSGVFALDDTDRTLAVLVGTMPIRVKQYTPLLVVVKPL